MSAVADIVRDNGGGTSGFLGAAYPGTGRTVEEQLTHNVATIGENMTFRRAKRLSVDNGVVASYVHSALAPGLGKIGVLVAINGGDAAKAAEVGKQVAMHVAATNPASLDVADLDAELVAREKQVLTDQARESGKPEAVIEKMITGRLNKFYQEVCLLKQSFVMNPDLTVEKAVAEACPGASVGGFARFAVGEGIEKEEEDFAAEVAKTMGG